MDSHARGTLDSRLKRLWSTPGPHSFAKCGPRARNSDKRKPSLTCGKALIGWGSFPIIRPYNAGHWFQPKPPTLRICRLIAQAQVAQRGSS